MEKELDQLKRDALDRRMEHIRDAIGDMSAALMRMEAARVTSEWHTAAFCLGTLAGDARAILEQTKAALHELSPS